MSKRLRISINNIFDEYPSPRRPMVSELGINAPHARSTHDGDLAVSVFSESPVWSRPCNIYYQQTDKTLLPLSSGQFVRCGGKFTETNQVVIAQSYLSGLAIKGMCSDDHMVVASLTAENLNPVIEFFRIFRKVTAAPDSSIEVVRGCPVWTPERTWVELYNAEVLECKAA